MHITPSNKTTTEAIFTLSEPIPVRISDRPVEIDLAHITTVTTAADYIMPPVTVQHCQVYGRRLTKTGKVDNRSGAGGWIVVPEDQVGDLFTQMNEYGGTE